jgi:DNA processing protein
MNGPTSVPDDVLLARAYLSRVGEPASVGLWDFVEEVGPEQAVREIRREKAPQRVLADTASRRAGADPEADLAAAQRHGLRLVVPEAADWPHFALGCLEHAVRPRVAAYRKGIFRRSESGEPVPPLALWVRGPCALSGLAVRSAGIVGARAATAYGDHVTADLAYGLARRGVEIVSGGAYGIDAAAHRAALAAQGVTVLVSAGGLDRPYPPGNAGLFERVAESGLLVSESPPGCAPQRRRFLTRNRLIAAFSTGVVVVEAAGRSGATNTASHSRTLGRPLMAVPGPVTSAMSVGCHDLLRRVDSPAVLVTSVDDVLAMVGSAGEGLAAGAGSTPDDAGLAAGDVRAVLDQLDPLDRAVFDGLPARRFATPAEIATRSGVGALEVIRALPALDLAGLIETSDAGYRIAARVRTKRTVGR